MKQAPLGIYLHIPFCVRKCLYCDFLSAPADEQTKTEYVEALLAEIRAQAPLYSDYVVKTVFFGGGTPSLLPGKELFRIMECLRQNFSFAPEEEAPEITMEANPGTLTADNLEWYRRAGINRLSIGLQSANDRELKALGRIHTWGEFLNSFKLAREAGFSNINVDLMSALPGQTPQAWMDTLKKTAALEPEHISAYSLIIEEGTPFYTFYGGEDRRRDIRPCRMRKRTVSCTARRRRIWQKPAMAVMRYPTTPGRVFPAATISPTGNGPTTRASGWGRLPFGRMCAGTIHRI